MKVGTSNERQLIWFLDPQRSPLCWYQVLSLHLGRAGAFSGRTRTLPGQRQPAMGRADSDAHSWAPGLTRAPHTCFAMPRLVPPLSWVRREMPNTLETRATATREAREEQWGGGRVCQEPHAHPSRAEADRGRASGRRGRRAHAGSPRPGRPRLLPARLREHWGTPSQAAASPPGTRPLTRRTPQGRGAPGKGHPGEPDSRRARGANGLPPGPRPAPTLPLRPPWDLGYRRIRRGPRRVLRAAEAAGLAARAVCRHLPALGVPARARSGGSRFSLLARGRFTRRGPGRGLSQPRRRRRALPAPRRHPRRLNPLRAGAPPAAGPWLLPQMPALGARPKPRWPGEQTGKHGPRRRRKASRDRPAWPRCAARPDASQASGAEFSEK